METGKLIAETLLLSTHIKKAWVVYGEIGLDEISPELKTRVWQIDNNLQAKNKIKRMESDEKQEEKDQKDRFIKEFTILPSDFGIKERKLASVVGGNKVYNAKIMKR